MGEPAHKTGVALFLGCEFLENVNGLPAVSVIQISIAQQAVIGLRLTQPLIACLKGPGRCRKQKAARLLLASRNNEITLMGAKRAVVA